MAANFAKLPELRPHLSCPLDWCARRSSLFKMPLTIGRYGHNRDSGDGCGLGCSHTDPGPRSPHRYYRRLGLFKSNALVRSFRFRGLTPVEAGPGFTSGRPVGHGMLLLARQ